MNFHRTLVTLISNRFIYVSAPILCSISIWGRRGYGSLFFVRLFVFMVVVAVMLPMGVFVLVAGGGSTSRPGSSFACFSPLLLQGFFSGS